MNVTYVTNNQWLAVESFFLQLVLFLRDVIRTSIQTVTLSCQITLIFITRASLS